LCRERHRTDNRFSIDAQGDVDGPVIAWRFPEFPGTVQGVDHPDALVSQAHLIVLSLLRQDRVIGAQLGEATHDHPVGAGIALVAKPSFVGGIGHRVS
jgi:hypothetical protein